MSSDHPEVDIKAPPCPNCGAKDVAAILYSHPGCAEEIHLDSETGHALIGAGADEYEKPPEWCCTRCNFQFGSGSATDAE